MKKKLFITLLTIAALTMSTQAQILKKGNTIIDGYYGFPNLFGSFLKSLYLTDETSINDEVGMLGPVGGKVEYLLSDKVGLGLNAWYSDAWVKWDREEVVLNTTTGLYETSVYHCKVDAPRTDVLLMFNYHFVNTESVDSYFCVGAGYHNRTYKLDTGGDPYWEGVSTKGIIPFNARVGIGMRYFFVENFGINIEFGLGGPLLHGGVCAKF